MRKVNENDVDEDDALCDGLSFQVLRKNIAKRETAESRDRSVRHVVLWVRRGSRVVIINCDLCHR